MNSYKLKIIKLNNLGFLLSIALLLQISGLLTTAAAFTNLEVLNYKACFDGVPLRKYPDISAPRMTTIPEGTMVKVDLQRGDWLRVIYKTPAGYFIGWSLATMMCRIN